MFGENNIMSKVAKIFALVTIVLISKFAYSGITASPSPCLLPQSNPNGACQVTISWSATRSYPQDPDIIVKVNGNIVARDRSGTGSITKNLERGEHTFSYSRFGMDSASGAVTVKMEGYTPFFNWTSSTHNEIVGDIDGDGDNDFLVQPLLEGDNVGLMPQESSDYLDSRFHKAWIGLHPQINDIDDWSAKSYGAFSANLSSAPGDEILLLGKKEVILLHGDIVTPIVLYPNIKNAIISWDSNGNPSYTSFNFDADPNDYNVHFGDFNGDGIDEILLQGKSQGSSAYILRANGTVLQTLYNGYQGLDWSGASYDLTVEDINGDGRADIRMVSKKSGVADNFAYSGENGQINSVDVAYHESESPKEATLVGTTSGEFRVNESGAATYSVNISAPAGTAGVAPQVSLNYSSSSGNGVMGLGWNLTGLSAVTRCASNYVQNNEIKGVNLSSSDRFCFNGQQLFKKNENETYGGNNVFYTTETFSPNDIKSIEVDSSFKGPEGFVVKTKSGDTHYFGQYNSSSDALLTVGGANKTWFIKRTEDLAGNYIEYNYSETNDGAEVFVKSIKYTGNDTQNLAPYNSIEFIYASELDTKYTRPDAMYGYNAGEKASLTKLLKQVRVKSDNQHLKTYYIYHEVSDFGEQVRTTAIQECSYLDNCLQPVEFDWSEADPKPEFVNYLWSENSNQDNTIAMDVNGSGITNLIYSHSGSAIVLDDSKYGVSTGNSISSTQLFQAKQFDYGTDGQMDLLVQDINGHNWKIWTYNEQSRSFNIQSSGFGHSDPDKVFIVDFDGDAKQDIMTVTENGILWYRQVNENREIIICEPHDVGDGETCYPTTTLVKFDTPVSLSINAEGTDYANYDFNTIATSNSHKSAKFSDFNGDGVTDLILEASSVNSNEMQCNCNDRYSNQNNGTILSGFFIFTLDNTTNTLVPWDYIGGLGIDNLVPFDVNRDGLTDILFTSLGKWRYRLSFGGNKGLSLGGSLGINADSDDSVNKRIAILDYDQNGSAEFWKFDELANGGRYFVYDIKNNTAEYSHIVENSHIKTNSNPVYGDFDADGTTDIIIHKGSHWKVWRAANRPENRSVKPNLVTKITSGYDNETLVTYSNLTDMDIYSLGDDELPESTMRIRTTMPVVSRVESSTDTNENLAVSYKYHDFRVHTNGRGVLGFKTLTTIDEQTGVVTETEYHQEYPFIGSPYKTTQKLPSGDLISYSENDWEIKFYDDGEFPYVDSVVDKVYSVISDNTPDDLQDNTVSFVSQTITKNKYDNEGYGNLLESEVLITNNLSAQSVSDRDGSQWFHTKTINDYGTTDYEKRYARLSSSEVTKARYDVTGEVTQTSSFTYYPETHSHNGEDDGYAGMLRTETTNSGHNKSVTKEHKYDVFGNRTVVITKAKGRNVNTLEFTGVESRTTKTKYDSKGRFAESITNDLGQKETYQFDSRFGGVLFQTGPNELTTEFKYDELGVKYHTQSIDGTFVREYSYLCEQGTQTCPQDAVFYSESRGYDNSGSPMTGYARKFYNKMGQEIVSTSETFDGKTIINRTDFDKFGRSVAVYMPVIGDVSTESSHKTSYTFDALGRVVSETAPNNGITTRSYNGLSTETTNAIYQTTTEVKNINGELLSVIDNNNKTMTYVYDIRGNFISVTDSEENTIENVYDTVGHKTQTIDPDKGTWKYFYNGFGELVRQEDARGVVIAQEYDVLGRMVRRVDNLTDINNIDVQTTCWDYVEEEEVNNTAINKAIGKLRSVALYSGNVSCDTTNVALQKSVTDYDSLGRASVATQILKDEGSVNTTQSYSTMNVYNPSTGRVDEVIYPRDFSIKKNYDQYGNVTSITNSDGSTVYKQIEDIDQFGNVTDALLGNGISEIKTYDDRTGYLEYITAGKNSGAEIVELDQAFDKIGNVTMRHDKIIGREEIFGYKENGSNNLLNRLTEYSVITGRDIKCYDPGYGEPICDDIPRIEALKSYSYDDLGNIKSKSDIGGFYKYGENGAGPHAVTSIFDVEGGTKLRSFNYDANGNMLGDIDHQNSANNRLIDYAAFEKPVRIQKGSNTVLNFKYGSNRSRYRRIDNVNKNGTDISIETTYLAGYEKVVHDGGDNDGVTEHKYYVGGTAIVIEKEKSGSVIENKTRYMHKDHLGSIIAFTDESGDEVQRFRYDPFGKQYQATAENNTYSFVESLSRVDITDRGFTGHEMLNDVDIIHMNGRIYDPNIGRFMQADAYVQAPKNMQNTNRYAYVLNNPLSYTDPSGHFFKKLLKKSMQMTGSWEVFKEIGKDSMLRSFVSIVLNIIPGCQAWCSAAFNSMVTFTQTGSLNAALKSGAITYGTSFALSEIGASSWGTAGTPENIFANAMVGGVSTELQGGKFGHGFVSAGFASALKPVLNDIGGANSANAAIKRGDLATLAAYKVHRVVGAAIIGGTASVLSGGKFANGAVTGAFNQLYNGEQYLKSVTASVYAQKQLGVYKYEKELMRRHKVQSAKNLQTIENSSKVLFGGVAVVACFTNPCGLALTIAAVGGTVSVVEGSTGLAGINNSEGIHLVGAGVEVTAHHMGANDPEFIGDSAALIFDLGTSAPSSYRSAFDIYNGIKVPSNTTNLTINATSNGASIYNYSSE